MGHIDGLPLGTRGGMKFRHDFHADGDKIRYLVDSTADEPLRGDTSNGLGYAQTEAAIDRAMALLVQRGLPTTRPSGGADASHP